MTVYSSPAAKDLMRTTHELKTPIEDMSNEDLLKLQEGHITLIQNSQSVLNKIAIIMQQRLEEPALLKTYDF
tara:strand:+ start:1189 stop:1404 length:216 start_codon:yes stop_codon:yes gene_type:complete